MTGFLARRYGYGAARLLLPAEPSPTHVSLGRARDAQDLLIALAIGALLVFGISNALQRADDELETRIVLLEPAPPPAEVVPEPELVVPEPVAPVVRAPEPPPPPPPKPPPPPPRAAPPKPPPVVRPAPPPPELVRPTLPPPRPAPAPPRRTPPRIEVAALERPELPAPPPPPRRAPELPLSRLSTPAPRPIAVAALEAPAAPERELEQRPRVAPPPSAPPPPRARPAPVVAVPRATPASESSSVPSSRVTRAPAPQPQDTRAARAPAPAVAIPAFAARSSAGAPAARSARPAAPAPPPSAPATSREAAPEIRGVPLGSLAACRSDREEDALKRRVLATVTKPGECTSAAGRYRLVETKNLNAFLMWIERAPHRPEADRCTELRLALECLSRSARAGSSR